MAEEEVVEEEQKEEAAENQEEGSEAPEETVEEAPEEGFSVKMDEPDRHDLSKDAVIDFEAILKPIPGENNAGEYLRYDGIYDEISEARRSDEMLAQGAWQTELKSADYPEVIKLAVPVIGERSKDLQISAWLCEALGYQHGFAGVRDGIRLLHLLLNNYWPGLYPEREDGDEEGRANALSWADETLADCIKKAPITADGWGYNGFLDSRKFDIPENLEGMSSDEKLKYGELRRQAERENRATAKQWEQAVFNTRRAFCEEVRIALQEIGSEYTKLNAAIEEKFERNQAPSLPEIRKALADVKSEFDKLLQQKRAEEPDESDEVDDETGEVTEGGGGGAAGTRGALQTRQDALRRLGEISAFFKRTEPHSPVSYLISRAIAWGNMPLEEWLEDVIKDPNILKNLRQTLGFNTQADTELPDTPAPAPAAPSPPASDEQAQKPKLKPMQ